MMEMGQAQSVKHAVRWDDFLRRRAGVQHVPIMSRA